MCTSFSVEFVQWAVEKGIKMEMIYKLHMLVSTFTSKSIPESHELSFLLVFNFLLYREHIDV